MKKYDKVFVPVDVNEKLPEDSIRVVIIDTNDLEVSRFNLPNKIFFDTGQNYAFGGVTHWLEEQSNVIVLTEDELNDIWNAAREKGFNPKCLGEQPDKYKTLNEFLTK